MTAREPELSTNLNAVKAETNKRHEKSAVVRGAINRMYGLICSTVGQSAELLDAFINQVGTQLENRVCDGQKSVYTGGQLSCPYTMTHISGARATSFTVRDCNFHSGGDWDAADANSLTPAPQKPSNPRTKGAVVAPRRLVDSLLHTG